MTEHVDSPLQPQTKDAIVIPPSAPLPAGTQTVSVYLRNNTQIFAFINPTVYRMLTSVPLLRVGNAQQYTDFNPDAIANITTVI